ncbi:MAG: BadF/BadG/BcrA/BcrD ATPase family protein [Pseudomonadota bacterium]
MTYFLGIDAGGSRCRARLASADKKVLAETEIGPANARIGVEKLRTAILDVSEQVFDDAGLSDEAMAETCAGLGVAGLSRPGMLAAVSAMKLPFRNFRVDTDAAIANLGVHQGEDGATLILGTGSIAYVRVDDRAFTIGGYGFPISDEGSGAALGLSAMRHALRALDGRTKPTPLSSAVTEQFDHKTERAIKWMDEATPRDYAALAPMVMAYANKNDAIARSIVEDAVKHVERFIETIFDKGAPRCALTGGLAPHLKPWLRERTAKRLCDAQGDPLDGALRLAGIFEKVSPRGGERSIAATAPATGDAV